MRIAFLVQVRGMADARKVMEQMVRLATPPLLERKWRSHGQDPGLLCSRIVEADRAIEPKEIRIARL